MLVKRGIAVSPGVANAPALVLGRDLHQFSRKSIRPEAVDREIARFRKAVADTCAEIATHAEEASAAGVFGVPAFEVDGKVFWGLDGLPMLRAYLEGDAWFEGPQWTDAQTLPRGATRK